MDCAMELRDSSPYHGKIFRYALRAYVAYLPRHPFSRRNEFRNEWAARLSAREIFWNPGRRYRERWPSVFVLGNHDGLRADWSAPGGSIETTMIIPRTSAISHLAIWRLLDLYMDPKQHEIDSRYF